MLALDHVCLSGPALAQHEPSWLSFPDPRQKLLRLFKFMIMKQLVKFAGHIPCTFYATQQDADGDCFAKSVGLLFGNSSVSLFQGP